MQPDGEFDAAALGRVKRIGGDALVRQLITVFLEHAPTRLAAARAAAASGDLQGLGRAAHALRGSAGNVGAVAMVSAADAIESACNAADPSAAALMAGLEAAWLSARANLAGIAEQLGT